MVSREDKTAKAGSSELHASDGVSEDPISNIPDNSGLEIMDTVSLPQTRIIDTPPKRVHDLNDLLNCILCIIASLLVLLASMRLQGLAHGVENDVRDFGNLIDNWLYAVPLSLLQQLVTVGIIIAVLIQLAFKNEWQQLAVSTFSLILGFAAAYGTARVITLVHDPLLLYQLSSLDGVIPVVFSALAAFLTASGPRKMHQSVKWGWNLTITLGLILIMLSADSLIGVLFAVLIGRAAGLLVRFAAGTLNVGVWGKGVIEALKNVGLEIRTLRSRTYTLERPDTSLRVSRQTASLDDDLTLNSRLYDAVDAQGVRYTVSVLDERRHSAGYLRQLFQWFQMSNLATRHDRTVRVTCHHHLDMLLGLRNTGLATILPYGVTDAQESGILVYYKDSQLHECDWGSVTDSDVINSMEYLEKANSRGYTHRRITPANLVRDDGGNLILAGWDNGDFASASTNVSLDRAQLLAAFAVKIGVQRTVSCAAAAWGRDYVYTLVPFLQRAAIPLETRQDPSWNRSALKDLRTRINALIPEEEAENTETITLARFNVRNFVGVVLLVIAAVVVFSQLNPTEMAKAVSSANPWMALLCFALGAVLPWAATSLSLGGFVDKGKRHLAPLFLSQVMQGFTAVTMPAGVGPAFVNLQYLRKAGYKNTPATAIMSAVVAIQVTTTTLLLIIIGIFTGRATLSGVIPTGTIAIVLGIAGFGIALVMAIKPLRKLVLSKFVPTIKSYGHELAALITQPKKLLACASGSVLQNMGLGLAFWCALNAFGYTANPIETTFVFLIANTLGSAVPTPGGLGAIEAALSLAFSGIGVPSSIALSATLLFRVMTYWLRIPLGALAMQWLNKHDLI